MSTPNENKPVVRQETSITAGMSREQIDLIKATVARGASDDELKLFLYTAQRTQLDPLTRQIHFIKRRVYNKRTQGYDEVGTIQTGIDGYRVVAARNGLAGIEDAVFDTETEKHPNKASVTVYRMVAGTRVPFTASARWTEYAQTDRDGNPTAMWKKMPYLMLAKVAEALALRKAFPNDLSGLYTNEEMAQADTEQPQPEPVKYQVKRIVPAEDDDEQSEPVNTPSPVQTEEQHVNDEVTEMQKQGIKDILRQLKKPLSKKVVKDLTGFDFEEKNYDAIYKALRKQLEKTDPLETIDA
jgi:phage recombination protein Bet